MAGLATTGLTYKGLYTVDETEHSGAPETLSIRARSADLRGSLKTKREHTWHDCTLQDVLQLIGQRNQLELRISESLAATAIQHLDQRSSCPRGLTASATDNQLMLIPATLRCKPGWIIRMASCARACLVMSH